MNESFADGGMFEPENKEAVKQVCALTAQRIREIANKANVGHDDLLAHLVDALDRIGAGESPDQAFGWAKNGPGRRRGNHERRDWEVRWDVREHLRAGELMEHACWAVSLEGGGEFLLGFESIKKICKGLNPDSDLPEPEISFPLPPRYRR